MKYLLILIILLNILYPSCETLTQTYQDNMISSGSRDLGRSMDLQFQIGPNIEGLMKWTRIRVGFPDRPIVIDIQAESRILQSRIDSVGFLKNAVPSYFCLLILGVLRFIKKKKRSS